MTPKGVYRHVQHPRWKKELKPMYEPEEYTELDKTLSFLSTHYYWGPVHATLAETNYDETTGGYNND